MKIDRRNFIQQNCAAIGSASLYSTLFTLRMTAGATTQLDGYKALVVLFLNGGNDSYNMLIPYTNNSNGYQGYQQARGGVGTDDNGFKNGTSQLAIAHAALENTVLNDVDGQPVSQYAVHPRLPFLQQQYNAGNLAFVANVGTLIEPTSLTDWQQGATDLPLGLFSHPDHQMHWQTVMPQVRGATPKGWGGRVADILTQANSNGQIGMNVSLAGNNTLQTGFETTPYVTSSNGAILLNQYDNNHNLLKTAVDSILNKTYPNMFEKTYAHKKKVALESAEIFGAAFDAQSILTPGGVPNGTTNNTNQTAEQLAGVIKAIKSKDALNMNRQIFFVERGGWDHHNELLDSQGGIPYPNSNLADGANGLYFEINEALEFFWNELVSAELENDVVLCTISDFGRTLTSNGQGSDHAWGGNAFVMSGARANNGTDGGPLKGGKIYGDYPVLHPSSIELDLDKYKGSPRGRILPTLSADEYLSELVSWFGVDKTQLASIFPNCTNFFDPNTTPFPLGMLD